MEIHKDSRDIYSYQFHLNIDNKDIILTLEVTEEYFRFKVFNRGHFKDTDVKKWLSEEMKNINESDKKELIGHEKWLYNYNTKGITKLFLT